MKKVLVACEESQVVCKAFRDKGLEAYSCDTQPCSGGYPEWHIQGDVLNVIDDSWDMMIAHPPCTHTAVSGAKHFEQKRKDGRQQEAVEFFLSIANAPISQICIEHPVSIMSSKFRKPDQIVQPWQFGHPEKKATCLWLVNLPPLLSTQIMADREQKIWKLPPTKDRAKLRSQTYQGIADAMAEQWAKI